MGFLHGTKAKSKRKAVPQAPYSDSATRRKSRVVYSSHSLFPSDKIPRPLRGISGLTRGRLFSYDFRPLGTYSKEMPMLDLILLFVSLFSGSDEVQLPQPRPQLPKPKPGLPPE